MTLLSKADDDGVFPHRHSPVPLSRLGAKSSSSALDNVFMLWRHYPSFSVSVHGDVMTAGGRLLKPYTDAASRKARVQVRINGRLRNVSVGRLVLTAFVRPPRKWEQCCHYPDRNVFNNRLDNLRWGTQSDNTKDSIKHGTFNWFSSKR